MTETYQQAGENKVSSGGLSSEEFLFLNRQLASILRLDLPLAAGLRSMAKEVRKPGLKRLVEAIRDDLDRGVPLTTALGKFPRDFPPLYLEILKAGEESGDLPSVLDELAQYSQVMADTRQRVIHTLTYPLFVVAVLGLVVVYILVFLIPQFRALFDQLPGQIPTATRAIFAVSDFLLYWKLSVPILGVVVVIILLLGHRLREGVRNFDEFVFHLPAMGTVLRLAALLKLCRTFADLLRTGVGLVTSLELTANTAGNNRMRTALLRMRDAVEAGRRFSSEAAATEAFPPTMVWKLTMAEERGMVEDALGEMATYYQRELATQCSRIENVLGPVLVVAIAVVVGGIVASLYMPLFSMQSALGGG